MKAHVCIILDLVGTPRCGVTARVTAGGTVMPRLVDVASDCAAKRAADGAARHPCQQNGAVAVS